MSKPPTSTDLKIFDYMKAGREVNSMLMYSMFSTTSHRCVMYRLRKAGYPIQSEMVIYKNNEGKLKRFCRYWVARGSQAKRKP